MMNLQQHTVHSKKGQLPSKQGGLVLFVTLIALLILMLTSVALIRSTDANLQIAGNLAFKRDLINQAERAVPQIQTIFSSGALSGSGARDTTKAANNYYATVQASNDSGIPNVLLAVTDANTNNIKTTDGSSVTIRYVIDRMCLAEGGATAQTCNLAGNDTPPACDAPCQQLPTYYPVYRLTLRATGPKNTEAYLQTTFSD